MARMLAPLRPPPRFRVATGVAAPVLGLIRSSTFANDAPGGMPTVYNSPDGLAASELSATAPVDPIGVVAPVASLTLNSWLGGPPEGAQFTASNAPRAGAAGHKTNNDDKHDMAARMVRCISNPRI